MEPQSLRTDDLCFEQVLQRYAGMVYRLAFAQVKHPSDAEDIFQDVFLRYVDHRPSFQNEEHRKAWLIRVTINGCKKRWRSVLRHRETPLLQQEAVHFDAPEAVSYTHLDVYKRQSRTDNHAGYRYRFLLRTAAGSDRLCH